MTNFLNTPFSLNSLTLPNRLIQGPLAGYSCAPFRELFSLFSAPAYCVSEMLSAQDVLHKHKNNERYLFRSPNENLLCYQIAGNEPTTMAAAAHKLASLGANIIDINCGCPKHKIRKKGAGSALLEQPEQLIKIISAVRLSINIPLTVKIRLQEEETVNIELAKKIADAGADALIVHGRRWYDAYDIPCNLKQIRAIKQAVTIPIIVNGDLKNNQTVLAAVHETGCDAFMIARAGSGKPWLFQEILTNNVTKLEKNQLIELFMLHLNGLFKLENEYKAVLQSRSLVRYYFKNTLPSQHLPAFYELTKLDDIAAFLKNSL
ncbi:nitrogen regulation protein [Legionella beliardensis]|uniref:tRNA-dihydrouridine synthase n=1 Tax=Legionella beliardensis TaxID=91822 RepID=A0A378I5Y6_9GAMM|nr:tRNA-dihydrouridine synthase family protein [Legionella beliardensis]STX30170.1 nitrogen regulation protein [Legionella beliardensis]